MDPSVNTTEKNGRPAYAGPADFIPKPYPIQLSGEVVKGFGRGSKELGIPTANLPEGSITKLCESLEVGVYYGWAQLEGDIVRAMVMSLGWNPYYKNEKRSAEIHIIHDFEDDFYGRDLNISILGYIRPELNYTTLEALVEDIQTDIRVAKRSLERAVYLEEAKSPFFT